MRRLVYHTNEYQYRNDGCCTIYFFSPTSIEDTIIFNAYYSNRAAHIAHPLPKVTTMTQFVRACKHTYFPQIIIAKALIYIHQHSARDLFVNFMCARTIHANTTIERHTHCICMYTVHECATNLHTPVNWPLQLIKCKAWVFETTQNN